MIVLSKRITRLDGSFGGVVTAAIDKDYFNGFYRTFQLGPDGKVAKIYSGNDWKTDEVVEAMKKSAAD